MQPYMVHVERQEVGQVDLAVKPQGGRAMMARYYQGYSPVHVEFNFADQGMRGEPSRYETWYCRNKQEADWLAFTIAKDCPGRSIMVLKLETVTQSGSTEPVVSNYSEKGVLPQ